MNSRQIKLGVLFVMCFGLCSCSLSARKGDNAASPTPSSQHESGATSGRAEAQAPAAANSNQSAASSASDDVKDDLHTPAKGTDERQAIMDGLREEFNKQGRFYTPHRGTITFVVNRLMVHNGWVWMIGYPQSTDPQDSFGEYSGFLLHKQDGNWRGMSLPPMINDPNDPENLDYPTRKDVERIRQKFPTAPADIFSK
jgi:hypothetical protein